MMPKQPNRNTRFMGCEVVQVSVLPLLITFACLALALFAPAEIALGQDTPPAQAAKGPDPAASKSFLNSENAAGSVEVGYRWEGGFRGNRDMYRSTVNMEDGFKLINANYQFTNPEGQNHYIDRFSLNASNWGDPYNNVRIFGEKYGAYRINFDYRNVDYFNNVGYFSNPLLDKGITVSQHSFDITRRSFDLDFTLLPTSKLSPFVAYSHNSGVGPANTTFTGDGNTYSVFNRYNDYSDYFRGGVVLTLRKFNLTLEQGWLRFRERNTVYQDSGTTNYGNRQDPLLGQTMKLTQLNEYYSSIGTTPISRIQISAFPTSKLTVSARLVYSKSNLDFDYDRRATGNFVSFDTLRFFTGDVTGSTGDAMSPRTSGSLALEYHPLNWLSIVDSLYLDHFKTSSTSTLGRALTGTKPISDVPDPNQSYNYSVPSANNFAINMNQNQVEGIVSITPKISFRGGYRYVWTDALLQDWVAPDSTAVSLNRNVGLAGFKFRLPKKAEAFLDLESGRSSSVYNRIDVLNYTKLRARGKYQLRENIIFTGSITLMDNKNPQSDINYHFKNWGYTFSASLAPNGGDRFSLNLDYSQSDLNSDIYFIIPQLLTQGLSNYVEDSRYGGFHTDVRLIRNSRISMGYGVISTTGTHPIIYHQPRASLQIPVTRRVTWINEWRYYDLNEKLYTFEKFHNNLITTSLRFSF